MLKACHVVFISIFIVLSGVILSTLGWIRLHQVNWALQWWRRVSGVILSALGWIRLHQVNWALQWWRRVQHHTFWAWITKRKKKRSFSWILPQTKLLCRKVSQKLSNILIWLNRVKIVREPSKNPTKACYCIIIVKSESNNAHTCSFITLSLNSCWCLVHLSY